MTLKQMNMKQLKFDGLTQWNWYLKIKMTLNAEFTNLKIK